MMQKNALHLKQQHFIVIDQELIKNCLSIPSYIFVHSSKKLK